MITSKLTTQKNKNKIQYYINNNGDIKKGSTGIDKGKFDDLETALKSRTNSDDKLNWLKAKEWLEKESAKLTLQDELPLISKSNRSKSINFEDAWAMFLDSKKRNRPKTFENYFFFHSHFTGFIKNAKIHKIQTEQIIKFRDHLYKTKIVKTYTKKNSENGLQEVVRIETDETLHNNTVINLINRARIFFDWCVNELLIDGKKIITKNPVPSNKQLGLKLKKSLPKEIPPEDLLKIMQHLKENNIWAWRFISFLRLTAVHPAEALNMNWQKINWRLGYIEFDYEKADEPHRFPLKKQLVEFLDTFRKTSGKMFPYKSRDSLRFWRRALKSLDLPRYEMVDIRVTTITDAIKAGASFDEIFIYTGHNDPKTTWQIYRACRAIEDAKKMSKLYLPLSNDDLNINQKENDPEIDIRIDKALNDELTGAEMKKLIKDLAGMDDDKSV